MPIYGALSDTELMDLVQVQSDTYAYAEICKRWYAPLHRYFSFRVKRRLQSDDADTCAGETLQRLWTGRHTWRQGSPFPPFIYRIAYRVWWDFLNRGQKGDEPGHDELIAITEFVPSATIEDGELLLTLFHARSARDKTILRWRFWPKSECPSDLYAEYENRLGDRAPEGSFPTQQFVEWLVYGYNNPTGKFTTKDAKRIHCSSGLCNYVCRRYMLEHVVFTRGSRHPLWSELLRQYVNEYCPARDAVLLYRWYSRNGAPHRSEIDAIFVAKINVVRPKILQYLETRSRESPASFVPQVPPPTKMQLEQQIKAWIQYRDRVLDGFFDDLTGHDE